MISLPLAVQLKKAGLVWHTTVHDFFAIPERGMDEQVFVLSDMMATMELLRGWPALVFHGTSEWALDYLLTHEAVWLPTESQLRQQVETATARQNGRFQQLQRVEEGYSCRMMLQNEEVAFTAVSATDAYGLALLYLLNRGVN